MNGSNFILLQQLVYVSESYVVWWVPHNTHASSPFYFSRCCMSILKGQTARCLCFLKKKLQSHKSKILILNFRYDDKLKYRYSSLNVSVMVYSEVSFINEKMLTSLKIAYRKSVGENQFNKVCQKNQLILLYIGIELKIGIDSITNRSRDIGIDTFLEGHFT